MSQDKLKFEIDPLDINIAQMQFNLLNRCEKEIPENGDFNPVTETFINKNPRLALSKIIITCRYDKQDSGDKNSNKVLSAFFGKIDQKDIELELFKGTKYQLIEYLKTRNLFETCKMNAIS